MKSLPVIVCVLVLAGFTSHPANAQTAPAPPIGLHMAVIQGNLDAVRQHIDAGTDLNQKDAFGSSPLILAAVFDKTEIAKALIEAGADLNIRNNDGGTPLHVAAFLCRTEIVRALLDHGADRLLRDHFANTPVDSIAVPFEDARFIYDGMQQALGPLGLKLDYGYIQATRPKVIEMLRPSADQLAAVKYAPIAAGDWPVCTPAEQGLDPQQVAELYDDAEAMPKLYSLLVIKNGKLVAEKYFNGSSIDKKTRLASVTKSFTSALTAIAIEKGLIDGLDQKMIDAFPDVADTITDPRKKQITLRQLLQMRAGYPWEEMEPQYWDGLLAGDYDPLIETFPLLGDPGTQFNYSNLSSNWLGIMIARAAGTNLKTFAQENLFNAIDVQAGEWSTDARGNNNGCGNLHLTARDAAKLGLIYLNQGKYHGKQIVPADWVQASLRNYSPDAWITRDKVNDIGPYFRDLGYGYQWWSAKVGQHDIDFAWGHGGQLIILLHDLNMIVATTTDAFFLKHDDEAWWHEKSTLNLVGKFVAALPEK